MSQLLNQIQIQKKCEHIDTKYSVLMQIYRNYILRVGGAAAIAFLCQQHTQRTQKKDERSTYLVPSLDGNMFGWVNGLGSGFEQGFNPLSLTT